jgi:DNA-directed RNA polymerase specialized sigma24 family protein
MSTETLSAVEAFEQAYSKFFGPVRAYLAGQCGDWHLAEDLAQDAYAELWRMLSAGKDLTEVENAYGLLKCLAKRMLGRHYGVMRNQRELLSGAFPDRDGKTQVEAMADGEQPGLELADQAVARVELGAALAVLAAGPRRAVGLRLVEDLTFVQAAERAGQHVDTVQSQFKQGLAQLREAFGVEQVSRVQEQRVQRERAAEMFEAARRAGRPMTYRALGARFGMSEIWARAAVREAGGYDQPASASKRLREGLSADLAAGRWAAGVRVWPKDLAEQYDTSASNVSTTLRQLAAQGVLVALSLAPQPGCAYYVPQAAAVRSLPMAA